MLPLNTDFLPKQTYIKLRRVEQQGTAVAIAVSATDKVKFQHFRLTLATDPTVLLWEVGMKAMLRDSGNANLFAVTIEGIDHTNKYLYVKDESNVLDNNITIDNVIQWGIIDFNLYPGDEEPIYNNDHEIIGYKNTTDGIFILELHKEMNSTLIQVINCDGSNALEATSGNAVTIKWSCDGLNWNDFSTATTTSSIAKGVSVGYILDYHTDGMKIKITIQNKNSADYYIIAR